MNTLGYWWRLFAQAITVFAAAALVVGVYKQVAGGALSYRDAVSKVLPSVVSIYGRDSSGVESSIGSGVIISRSGYVLTNYHLIANVGEIEIGLKNGDTYLARLIGIDPDIDIAVLKVEADDLPAIGTAEDKSVQPGDIVFAIGNPFGLNRSTTMGIVSAIGRDRLGLHGFEQFIQTDAAINPGSSGGALADTRGQLIGINSALFYRQHGIAPQGIGFAIPVGLVMNSYQRLIREPQPAAGDLGAEIRALSPRLRAEVMDATHEKTVHYLLVTRVWQGSIAARQGMEVGDIVVSINGAPARSHVHERQLRDTARQLEIIRGKDKFTLNLAK